MKCEECGSKNVTITDDSWSTKPFNTIVYCQVVDCNDCKYRFDINSEEELK